MSNIFKKPKPSQPRGRNGFDMSFHRSFTAPCGMLLPVAKDFANPGDNYKLNSSLFIRTEALQSAAFQKFKVHVDWFFVPVSQLYSLWGEFFYSQNDQNSSAFTLSSKPELPLFKLKTFLTNSNSFVSNKLYETDEFGTPLCFNFRRLWDMFGYGSLNRWTGTTYDFNVPLLDFLSYHRIFYSHYCLTDWTTMDNTLYNVDQFYKTTPSDAATKRIISTIHYRRYHTDYFTNIMPQPFLNSNFANTLTSSMFGGNIRNSINKELTGFPYVSSPNIDYTPGVNPQSGSPVLEFSDSGTVPTAISSGDIRAVFALDKLLRASAFAGSHYDQQTLAHFGYQMPQGVSKEVYFLGSQQTDVTIGEVVATASTGADGAGSTLGDIAGKGFGTTNGQSDCSFTCPEHGYIMAIFSIEPIQTYSSMGCDSLNRYSNYFDFYREEFDNLGMQPAFRSSYDAIINNNASPNNYLLGWQYRWSELKTKYDVVNESFWATDRSTWVATKQMSTNYDASNEIIPNRFFYISPTYTNSIFLVNFNSYKDQPTAGGSWTDNFFSAQQCYGRDAFLIDADFKIFKTSIMSTHSLPKF